MLAATDWAGIAACISAFFAGIIGLLTYLRTGQVHAEVKNPNGTTSGIALDEVHAAVTTPPGQPSIGQLAADVADTLGHGQTPPHGTPAVDAP